MEHVLKMKGRLSFAEHGRLVAFILVLLTAGCVSAPRAPKSDKPVFYPPPPDLPRYQFLTSYQGTGDFKEKGSGLDAFLGTAGGGGYILKKPFGVVMQNKSIYIVDTQATVFRFDLFNRKVTTLKGAKGLGKLVQPINISLDAEGNKYVCDPVRRQVIMYDKNDFYVRAFSYAKPWKPVDAEVFEGQLFVVDSTKAKGGIMVFDLKSGEFLEKIGDKGPPDQRLAIGTNLAIDKDGYLYVMDAGRFQIVKYDRDGHYRGHLGEPGDSLGQFGRPRGIAIDRDGRIYACDAAYNIVQVFAHNGQVLTFFGGSGAGPGTLSLPAGVFLDYDQKHIDLFKDYIDPDFEVEYLVLVTSQFHKDQSVNVYGFGKKRGAHYKDDAVLYDEMLERLRRLRNQQ